MIGRCRQVSLFFQFLWMKQWEYAGLIRNVVYDRNMLLAHRSLWYGMVVLTR